MSDELPLIGFGLPVSGSWATPPTITRVARQAEERGYASLWTFQRVLSPVAGGPGADGPNPGARPADDSAYRSVHDALLPLAYVAANTERIGLGTATICAPFTPPALLAKSMTTLDHLSDGRLSVGVGIGWMPEEYAAAGVPWARRGARMEEYLRCLHALWADEPVEFAGEFYTVPRSYAGPKPRQRPRPPVLLGGAAEPALRRAGRLAEGWIGGSGADPSGLERSVRWVREGAEEAGRDPDAVRILVRLAADLVDAPRPRVLEELARLRRQGATEVIVDLNFSPRVGSPDVDPAAATSYADGVLDAFAPPELSG